MQRTIFFDLGWTLENEIHSQLDRAQKAVAYCRNFGISSTIDAIIQLQDEAGKNGISNVFKYALAHIGVSEAQLPNVFTNAQWNPMYLVMYDDAQKVLASLSRHNILGIIANQSKPVDDRLIAYDIYQYFKLVISSCDVGHEKPDLEIFRLALHQLGTPNCEYWMVGDRIDNDIVPAKRMGWKTIRLLQGSHRMQEPISELERPDYTVNTLLEILAILN